MVEQNLQELKDTRSSAYLTYCTLIFAKSALIGRWPDWKGLCAKHPAILIEWTTDDWMIAASPLQLMQGIQYS